MPPVHAGLSNGTEAGFIRLASIIPSSMSEHTSIVGAEPSPPSRTRGQALWRHFCRLMVKVFYRRVEFHGAENIPRDGAVLLCANHVNALVDAVVVQAASPRPIHPIARSGLFRSPFLRPILRTIQAVPIYRRRPVEDGADSVAPATAVKNEDSFRRCFEYLQGKRVILIFPEGQSHSDPRLRALKTGAARLALGAVEHHGRLPQIVPVGLTFTHKGRFRANVLVQFGPPIDCEAAAAPEIPPEHRPESAEPVLDGISPTHPDVSEDPVHRLTRAIGKGLEKVTLNVDSWEDLELLKLIQGFFTLRKSRRTTMGERFLSMQRLSRAHRRLRLEQPGKIARLREKLQRFERLCRRYGVQDYHLRLRYRPLLVLRFIGRCLAFAVFVVPLALWGFLNAALPYYATRLASRLSARGRDQYDTAGMVFGLFFHLLFWGAQSAAVFWFWGTTPALLYATSLPITAAIALKVGYERLRIQENVRVFFLFMGRGQVREYLALKRQELEAELAHMARLARRSEPSSP